METSAQEHCHGTTHRLCAGYSCRIGHFFSCIYAASLTGISRDTDYFFPIHHNSKRTAHRTADTC